MPILDYLISQKVTRSKANTNIADTSMNATSMSRSTSDSEKLNGIMDILRDIQPTIKSMKEDIEEVKSQLKTVTTEQNSKISKVSDEISVLREEVKDVISVNHKLEAKNCDLSDRINRLESYSRRSNLIFSNVEEDQAPIINTVRNIMTKMGVTNPNDIVFDDIHRLGAAKATRGRPRPIIVRFLHRRECQLVWDS